MASGPESSLQPDVATIQQFLAHTVQSDIHLVAILPDEAHPAGRWFGENVAAAARWSVEQNLQGKGVYWTANVVRPGLHKKPRKTDISAARFLHTDIDPPFDRPAMLERLLGDQHPPSAIIDSGNGLQPVWRLDSLHADPAAIEDLNRRLSLRYGGDNCHNIDRLLRLPGTVNYPSAAKRAKGRVTCMSRVQEPDTGETVSLADLDAYLPPLPTKEKPRVNKVPPEEGALCSVEELGITTLDPLHRLIIAPANVNRSNDVWRVAAAMAERGFTDAQIIGILLNPAYRISAHCLEQADPLRAARRALRARADQSSDARREAQRAANADIGEGCDVVPTACLYTLEEMCEQFVFIKDGSQVAPLDRPQAVLAYSDFKNATAASKHFVERDGRTKAIPAAVAWLEHPKRLEAEALTFKAGGGRITVAPNSGKRALNLWTPIRRSPAPDDWRVRSVPFVEHVQWLWGEDADVFLDWLAHIEQHPGVLPHYGWVHISREHGKGRNWISSVLTRLWPGYVAASLDLVSILDGGFNGRMSRKLLAIVDEINEGGNTSYRHAQTLRQLVTAEHREINPKYGRQHVEYNACRWLMFSNHTGAIPLGEDDRRFWIVSHQGEPHPPDYYTTLYDQLDDRSFIASVAEFLKQRDVTAFKPGQRPPMNEAKAELVSFGQTEDDLMLKEVVAHWPVDLITNYELTNLLEDGGPSRPAARHAMDRAGLRKLARRIRLDSQGSQRAHIVRNYGRWSEAPHAALKAEVERMSEGAKREAIGRGGGW
jgi:hypothetical protein